MISIENYTHTLLRKISEAGGEGRAGGRPLDRREDGEAADPGGTGDRPGYLSSLKYVGFICCSRKLGMNFCP